MKTWSLRITALAMALNLAGCGTLIYPERIGHHHTGKLDPMVTALDAAGLLFFVIPGIVALAVDYNNGTIYLPNRYASENGRGLRTLHAEAPVDRAYLEGLLAREYGVTVELGEPERGHSLNEVRLLGAAGA